MDIHSPSTTSRILQIAAIVLTVITAVNHLFIGIANLGAPDTLVLAVLFILNAAGFAVLLAGLSTRLVPVLSGNRILAHYAMIAFTVVTIMAYVFMSGILRGEPPMPMAIVTKIDELLLILATYLHLRVA
mgnify:FL=1